MIMDQFFATLPPVIRSGSFKVSVPGSKSVTNRALILSALTEGKVRLLRCSAGEDGNTFLLCLKDLGFDVQISGEGSQPMVTILGAGGEIPKKEASINVGSSGTAARFLLALLAFSEGEYIIDASEQMKRRPIGPLVDALTRAGTHLEYLEDEGRFPVKVGAFRDHSVEGGEPEPNGVITWQVDIRESSQFLSALMIAAGNLAERTGRTVRIRVQGSHGMSYVDLTAGMMRRFGYRIAQEKDGCLIAGRDRQAPETFDVDPDMSLACYFYGLAALLGVSCEVEGIRIPSQQADERFLEVLGRMGCEIEKAEDGRSRVTGPAEGRLKGGFTVDMSAFSDQALTLAALAPYADAPIGMTGIDHIRLQECDRIRAILDDLSALGIKAIYENQVLTIWPGEPKAADLETYGDHRVAMAFSLMAARTEGIRILDPDCCRKTFPDYFITLENVLRRLASAGA